VTLHAIKRADPRDETEEAIHKAVVQLLMLCAHPRLVYYHCANGEARSRATGAKLKAMGVLAGVADLNFVLPDGKAAFIELKNAKGRQSVEQKEFQRRVEAAGALYEICRSSEEVRRALGRWGALRTPQQNAFREAAE